jgi:hypothetical protein
VEDLILAQERQRRFGSELRKFMADLESTSYVQEDLPADAVGFRTLADDFEPEVELPQFRAPLGAAAEVDEAGEDGDAGAGDAGAGDAGAGDAGEADEEIEEEAEGADSGR